MSFAEHLYLHVPFCRLHCPYCDFPVTADVPPDLSRWRTALRRELAIPEVRARLSPRLRTVHVGGGTPSILGRDLPQEIRAVLGDERLATLDEWGIEANPEDLDDALLLGWRRAGVTRVNVGIQSLDARALEFLGRRHDPDTGVRALRTLRGSGLESWGVDLLYGLSATVDSTPRDSLEGALRYGPPHISLYELALEEETPLGRAQAAGSVELADGDLRADQYLELAAILEREGYEAYEMTAFARPGHESHYGRAVLAGEPYLGLGAGALSRIGGLVRQNSRNWRSYERWAGHPAAGGVRSLAVSEPGPEFRLEVEPSWARLHDRLRLREGLSIEELTAAGRRIVGRWDELGWVRRDPDRVRLTLSGWLRLDALVIELDRSGGVVDQKAEQSTTDCGENG